MAYNKSPRFAENKECFRILDPTAYEVNEFNSNVPQKAPFLSKTPRKTQANNIIWTHALYHADTPHKIPNITSLSTKTPRFPYETFSLAEFEEILCRCDISTCECPTEEEKEVVCQGRIIKHLYKGHVPFTTLGTGESVPTHGHRGYEVLEDGRKIKIPPILHEGPPIYDPRVNEATHFYRGCKWSKWSSRRSISTLDKTPGPADYSLNKGPTAIELCQEQFRSIKRQTSRQVRYIEHIQQINFRENFPGPAHYDPKIPKGTNLKYLGPKANRFQKTYVDGPGATNYRIKRDFDLPDLITKPCIARLPKVAPFGVKAERFIYKPDYRPSPAEYDPRVRMCHVLPCTQVGFSSTSKRFKDDVIVSYDSDDENLRDKEPIKECPNPTWGLKSKTLRFKPLIVKENEPSPADLPQTCINIKRHEYMQYMAPFFSSEGRFRTWYNWIPIMGKEKTAGPGSYDLEKSRCPSAVNYGPLYRSPRFIKPTFLTPAPNEYKVGGGLETILKTYNQKLKRNIKQVTFLRNNKAEPILLSSDEKENLLLNKSIALLNFEDTDIEEKKQIDDKNKPKLLRCFLFKHPIKNYF